MSQRTLFDPPEDTLASPAGPESWPMLSLPDLLDALRSHGLVVVQRDWLTDGMAIDDCLVAEIITGK